MKTVNKKLLLSVAKKIEARKRPLTTGYLANESNTNFCALGYLGRECGVSIESGLTDQVGIMLGFNFRQIEEIVKTNDNSRAQVRNKNVAKVLRKIAKTFAE